MWVRIRRPHRGPFVLKKLHIVDIRQVAQFNHLFRPHIDHPSNVRYGHFRQRQVVARTKADDATTTGLRCHLEELPLTHIAPWAIRQERSKIIFKDKDAGVSRVMETTGPFIAGAEVALGIISRSVVGHPLFYLSLPGALGAMGGD